MRENNYRMEKIATKISMAIWKICNDFEKKVSNPYYMWYVSTVLFIKFLSDTYKEDKENAKNRYMNNQIMIERFLERRPFRMRDNCTFEYLYEKRNNKDIGTYMNNVLEEIILLNKEKLKAK